MSAKYAGNLIYGVRLLVNVRGTLAKKSSVCCCIVLKKKLKKLSFLSDRCFGEGSPNFNFSLASINSNYGDIFPSPNKVKFGDNNICTKLFIREQKVINKCPSDTLISFKSYV